jgi:2-polyprenyl-6-methoxyphenol hydroxylase-like FAD-dependent oxidoreductase
MPLKVIIAGAGLGGLGAAIAMARAGHDVEVQSDNLRRPDQGKLIEAGIRTIKIPERNRCRYSHCTQRNQGTEILGYRLHRAASCLMQRHQDLRSYREADICSRG